MGSCPLNHVTIENHYISPTTVPMATKFGKMMTYSEQLPSMKLLDPVATKLGSMVAYLARLLPLKLHDTLSSGFARLRDKLKTSYLHYQSSYGHQTWEDGDLP